MFILLKATFVLFCLIAHISSRPTHRQELSMKEIVKKITNITSGAQARFCHAFSSLGLLTEGLILANIYALLQIPCNNTRVMRVTFTDPKLPESEKLCQATEVLKSVTKCKDYYEPILSNLLNLHGSNNCSMENGDEIYLRNFLPQLGNYTQGLFRNLKGN